MLPAFEFTARDAADASEVAPERVERFLDTFSCGPNERNVQFKSVGEINITNFSPIIKASGGLYVLLQHFSLLEAIYESPFYWMAQDVTYGPVASINRGRFTESFVADRLDKIFGDARVLRNVNIYKGKNRFAEADALVLYGDRAIVLQAKSKRLTIEARKGNDFHLKEDFKRAVQDAYDQILLCAGALTSNDFKFVTRSGREIKKIVKPRLIFPVCVVSDHYPALAFQSRQFLKTNNTAVI
jgi:hypothetical protein